MRPSCVGHVAPIGQEKMAHMQHRHQKQNHGRQTKACHSLLCSGSGGEEEGKQA